MIAYARAAAIGLGLLVAAAPGFAGSALQFDGVSSYVALTTSPATNLTNNFTVEAWVNVTTGTGVHRILSNRETSPNRGYGVGTRNLNWRMTTFGIKDYDSAASTVTTGTWTHIAYVLDAANAVSFYKDGVLLSTVTHTAPAVVSTTTLLLGRNPSGTEMWEGSLDEVRIWSHARTQAQIQDNMNTHLYGNEPGLVLYLPFEEGSGTAISDATGSGVIGTLFGATWVPGPPLTANAREWELYP